MPLRIIPNKLSFIWVGPEFPSGYADNLIRWAMYNPHYEINLWTENHLLESSLGTVSDAFNYLLDRPHSHKYQVHETDNGLRINLRRNFFTSFDVNINSIGTLPPVVDPTFLYEELTSWKNYGAVSDILRISVVYNIGGIYMDMDTYPDDGSLPRNIYAPHGLLLCELTEGNSRRLITPVIASSIGNEYLVPTMQELQRRYEQDYPMINEGVYAVSEATKQRLKELYEVREDAKVDGRNEFFVKQKMNRLLVEPTLARSGGVFNQLMLFLPENFSLGELSFQRQARYSLGIGNDSTWVR